MHDLPTPSPTRTIQDRLSLDPATLKVLADPIRSFVIYSLVPAAKTVKVLAQELGCPTTRLYYHMQQLEKHGLIFVERTALVSGIVEKHYRAAAREWVLDRGSFMSGGSLDRSRSDALLSFVFDQSRIEIAHALEDGRIDPVLRWPAPGALMAVRNVLKLDDAQAARLYERLHDFWVEYDRIAHEPAENGRFYALVAALYPNDMPVAATGGARNAGTQDDNAPPARRGRRRRADDAGDR